MLKIKRRQQLAALVPNNNTQNQRISKQCRQAENRTEWHCIKTRYVHI